VQFTFYQIFNIFAQMFFQIVSFYLTAMAAIGIVSGVSVNSGSTGCNSVNRLGPHQLQSFLHCLQDNLP
jgi:hypothetical protein